VKERKQTHTKFKTRQNNNNNDKELKLSFRNDINSILFFIIYVPSQQLQGQLQTQHSVGTGNNIKDKHNIKTTATYNNNNNNNNNVVLVH
jgi:hypothetical protein